ncbi:MAG: hypothetical protein ABIK96_03645 [bacterium]
MAVIVLQPHHPSPAWNVIPFTLNVGGLSIPPEGCIYLRLNCTDHPSANSGRNDFALEVKRDQRVAFTIYDVAGRNAVMLD